MKTKDSGYNSAGNKKVSTSKPRVVHSNPETKVQPHKGGMAAGPWDMNKGDGGHKMDGGSKGSGTIAWGTGAKSGDSADKIESTRKASGHGALKNACKTVMY